MYGKQLLHKTLLIFNFNALVSSTGNWRCVRKQCGHLPFRRLSEHLPSRV